MSVLLAQGVGQDERVVDIGLRRREPEIAVTGMVCRCALIPTG